MVSEVEGGVERGTGFCRFPVSGSSEAEHFLGSLVAFLRGFIGGLLRVLLQRVTGLLGRFLGCAAGILRGLFGGVTSVIHVLLCAGVVLLRNGERARR